MLQPRKALLVSLLCFTERIICSESSETNHNKNLYRVFAITTGLTAQWSHDLDWQSQWIANKSTFILSETTSTLGFLLYSKQPICQTVCYTGGVMGVFMQIRPHLARDLIPQPNTGTHALASACQNRIMLRDAVHHHRDPCLILVWPLHGNC